MHPIVLYGENQPAVLHTFHGSLERLADVRPYGRHRLDLPDILLASGHVLCGSSSAQRVWPPPDELTEAAREERYGRDGVYSTELHAAHHAWAAACTETEDWVPYRRLAALLSPQRLERWQRSLRSLADSRNVNNLTIQQKIYSATK